MTNNKLRRIVDKNENQSKYITNGSNKVDYDSDSDAEYNKFINDDNRC